MAKNRIKGLIIEIGGDTTELGKALDDVNSKSSKLSKELGSINKLLKLDPTNTELLAQKQKVLAEAISNTEEKLDALRAAEKQVQAQFEKGEISEAQYRGFQREIIAAENKLNQYKKAVQETAEAAEKFADGTKDAAQELDKEADKAKDAENATDDLCDSLADTAKNGFTALAAAATAAVAAIVATAEASREYRTEMGKLDAAYISSGHSSATATAAYKELQSIIGETDQAVEAAQQIALLADSAEDVAEWSELAAGVVGKFGDALQPETFYEAANETIKLGEATGAYTQMLEGVGMSVETFNEGLAECTTEGKKQEYMLKVTKKALGSAATQYKKTNKEVIRANKATEDWNAAIAEVGGYVEPVITDIKEMGVALLEDAEEPLKAVADFVRTKFLPAVTSIGNWVKQNFPTITAGLAGLTAALVAHKVAVLASEAATKGLTLATVAQELAQKALNLVMAAGPWGIVMTAVAGVTTALTVLALTTEDATGKTEVLTKAERDLMAAADETSSAFRNQQAATQDAMSGLSAEMGHVQDLSTELQNLADASGRVQEKDQARAQFILNELNDALGTEYTMIDGVIQQYDTLKASINDVIQAKLANSLVETANADYVAAIQAEEDALANLVLKEKDYQAQLEYTQQKEKEYTDLQQVLQAKQAAATNANDVRALAGLSNRLNNLRTELDAEKKNLAEKKNAYDQAASDYGNYYTAIANYEDAQAAVLDGNYERAIEILTKKGQAFGTYSDQVDEATAAAIDALFKEAVDAGIAAERIKKHFENGIEGYTEDMVSEAEQAYKDALDAYANAYADAESIGEDLGDGLSNGMESKRSSLRDKAQSLVSSILGAMRKAADSHSPARKTIDFGEDMGEGAEIGIDNKTKDVKRAATNQAAAVLEAYRSQEVAGQNALRSVADRQAALRSTSQMAAAATNSAVLDKILAAIERGQVITIDGNLLIGATANGYDQALGLRRDLMAKGAL